MTIHQLTEKLVYIKSFQCEMSLALISGIFRECLSKSRQYTFKGTNQRTREDKQLFHLQAQRFETETSARDALDKIVQKLNYHKLGTVQLTQHVRKHPEPSLG